MEPTAAVSPPDHGVERHVPDEPHGDDRGQHSRRHHQVAAPLGRVQGREDGANLQADENEREDVQREHHRVPDRVGLETVAGRHARRRRPGRKRRVAHHRQHARQPDVLGENPHAERADELQDDRRRHVLHPVHEFQGDPAECRADDDAADDRQQEHRGHGGDREAVGQGRAHGQPVDEKRARVVQQALAFEDGQEAMRRAQRTQHRRGGDRVRGRHDRPENDCGGPRQTRNEGAGHDRHGDRRERHGEHHQPGHRQPVVLEIPERSVEGRVEQHWRHEERQRQLRRDGERPGAR